VQVRLLGPLEVFDDDGVAVAVSGAKLRALLARLALDPGRPVPPDRLLDDIWGSDLPETARNALQVLVSKLRQLLGRDVVVHRSGGYLLDVPAHSVDIADFERLAAAGRAAFDTGDHERAVSLFEAALGIWRGAPLADFAYEEFAQPLIGRLGEARVVVEEDRVEAALALGRHAALIGDIESLVAEYPLRERLRGQLMLALYRSGRQAEALRAFQYARQMLNNELGLEPSPELRRLEAAILAQDPALELAGGASPKPASPRRRSNLPVSLTPLVGRVAELAALRELLRDRRLVTLIGPGGVGKTRLAVEAARVADAESGRGAWLVEFAPLGDPAGVAAAVVSALDVADQSSEPMARLLDYLAGKDLLLVLDNCEHVVGEAARVAAALLGGCPLLLIVATSREVLGVPGEAVFATPPLQLGDAVALFVERATAADPRFVLEEHGQAAVADVCERLDGLPLAVELAAARARVFGVGDIAARLDDRFRLLTGGARTALPRQQTLRAVVDWSYDLLFDDERRLFDRMSVFAGGCSLPAAEAVCAGDDIPTGDVVDTLSRLVDKSLVVAEVSPTGARYRLLQTLAFYGREHLSKSGEASLVRDRHGAFYVELAARSRDASQGIGQRAWVTEVRDDLDNLRGALAWALELGRADEALTLAGGLGWFFWVHGGVDEGREWLDAALALGGFSDLAARAVALVWSAYLGMLMGRAEDYEARIAEGLSAAERSEDAEVLGQLATTVAFLDESRGDPEHALTLFGTALAAFGAAAERPWIAAARTYVDGQRLRMGGQLRDAERVLAAAADQLVAAGDLVIGGFALHQVADLADGRGDYATATAALTKAVMVTSGFGFEGFEAMMTARLGTVAMLAGDLEDADMRLAEAEALGRELHYPAILALALNAISMLRRRQGRIEDAAAAAADALALYRAGDIPEGSALALINLGFAAELRADAAEAARCHREAFAEATRLGDPRAVARAVEGLAGAAMVAGEPDRAARLLGAADELRRSVGSPLVRGERFDVDRTEAALGTLLEKEAIVEARREGAEADLASLVAG
jgi:predicted ATPase/DNA-binding SARP family transcriptional activator